MSYDRSFLIKLQKEINLYDLVSEYTSLTGNGKSFTGRCPSNKHNDSDPSFNVTYSENKDGEMVWSWRCFGCHQGKKDLEDLNRNFGTDVIAFYQWINYMNEGIEVSFNKAVEELCEKYQIPIQKRDSKINAIITRRTLLANAYQKNLNCKSKKYLYERGLCDKDLEEWKIGYNSGRIIFPLLNTNKEVLGFSKRLINYQKGGVDKYGRKLRKYINSNNDEVFNKSTYFYGLHNIERDIEEIRITEGAMDVIMPTKYGAKNIVATLGTALTDKHIAIIKAYKKVPVLILDGDKAGIDSLRKNCKSLFKAGLYPKLLILPKDMDLCELTLIKKESIEEYINMHSFTYGQYLINTALKKYNDAKQELDLFYTSKINEYRVNFLKEAFDILDKVPDNTERLVLERDLTNNIYGRDL